MEEMFICIRYHVNWPGPNDPYYLFNITENNARKSYYGVNSVPRFHIDGTQAGASENLIWNRAQIQAPLDLSLSGYYDETLREGQVTVTIHGDLDPGLTNLKLRVALIENEIYYNTPYSDIHNQTFRDMLPNTYGEPITITQGETLQFTYDFSVPSPLIPGKCRLIAYVQSDNNREILQGVKENITGLVSSIDDDLEIPALFELSQNYPNPFNAETQIGFRSEGGEVTLEVYNLTGSLVKTLVDGSISAGDHFINWDGTDNNGNLISSGVYFYKLSNADRSEVKRMTLLK